MGTHNEQLKSETANKKLLRSNENLSSPSGQRLEQTNCRQANHTL